MFQKFNNTYPKNFSTDETELWPSLGTLLHLGESISAENEAGLDDIYIKAYCVSAPNLKGSVSTFPGISLFSYFQ